MTVRVNKPSFNLREKLSELTSKFGLKGTELARAETVQDARDIISAGRRNLIINGAMNVSQRGTILSGKTTSSIIVDRFNLNISMGTWTIEQHPTGPDGFDKCFKSTCTSPTASPSANNAVFITQTIEARNLKSLKYGSSSARDMTISFWVQSNKTGDATLTLLQNDNSNRMMNRKYTINNANTWEYKTITIPGDVSGIFNDDGGEGLQVEWWLDGGSTFIGGGETNWRAFDNTYRNPNNLQLGRTDDDYFSITGVQLEVGKNATDFEYLSYGEDLALCQRYYVMYARANGSFPICNIATYGTARAFGVVSLPVEMRGNPTVEASSGGNNFFYFANANGGTGFSTITLQESSPLAVTVETSNTLTATDGAAGWIRANTGTLAFNAEY